MSQAEPFLISTSQNKKREAEAYLRDQNELAQRQSALWQVYMMECRKHMATASAAIEQLRARLDEEIEKHAGSQDAVEELTRQLAAATTEFKAAEKEADKVGKEFAKFEREALQSEEKRKHVEGKRKKVEKSLADEKRAISAAKTAFADAEEQAEKLQGEIAQLEASLEKEETKLESIRESLKDKTQDFTAKIEARQRELEPWTAKIIAKRNEKEIAVGERDLLVGREEEARAKIEEAQEALRELEEDAEGQNHTIDSLRKEKAELAGKVRSAEQQLQGMRADETKLRSSATSARNKVEEAKAASSSQETKNQVLASLSRQAELGMIKGFHGRLGSLGIIEEKYDVAISTACPGLDSIVVDNVDGGQACIEHLRKNNLGRANFILLDSLDKSPIPAVKTPEDTPRLFDLVKSASPRYAAAFYHQLRDTLVADNLAHANRLAYGATRWRVVTLDGQLIDKSGAMSGGGARVARGAMSSKPRGEEMTPEKMARLEKERALLEGQLRSHLNAMQEIQATVERCRTRGPEIDIELDKAQMAVEVGKQRRRDGEQRLKEIQAEAKLDASESARVAQLEKLISSHDAELVKFARATETIESAIKELQDRILEVGGIELRTQQSKVDGMNQMIELTNERLTKATVAGKKSEKDLAKAQQHVVDHEKSLSALEAELAGVNSGVNVNSKDADAAQLKVQKARDNLEDLQSKREEIQEKLDEFTEGVNAFRALEVSLGRAAAGDLLLTYLACRWDSSKSSRTTRSRSPTTGSVLLTGPRSMHRCRSTNSMKERLELKTMSRRPL